MKSDNKVYLNALEVENLKRIKAVKIDCSGNSLTVIGGKNGQGKTSVLDAISYALGGERYRPSGAKREGSVVDPEITVTLSNGLVVERKGKNSTLKVTDPDGRKAGQQLLNEFLHGFALDLPKFLNASSKEKADTLLQIIGVGDKLVALDKAIKAAYDERHTQGRIADQKKKFAEEMPYHADVPEKPIAASDLIKEQQAILAKNGENMRLREQLETIETRVPELEESVARARRELAIAESRLDKAREDLTVARKSAAELQDESTEAIEKRIAEIEDINAKIRANLDKQKALEDSEALQAEYEGLSERLDELRKERKELLDGAKLPLEGLGVEDGELTFKGQRWDCMSGAEQLIVATAVVKELAPNCGFVLLDRLEQMDLDTLREFGGWLDAEGLQAIATRVSTGDECSIIIEDGVSVDSPSKSPERQQKAAPAKLPPSKPVSDDEEGF
jgi:predicted ATP-dependent endonuclease of OLD family